MNWPKHSKRNCIFGRTASSLSLIVREALTRKKSGLKWALPKYQFDPRPQLGTILFGQFDQFRQFLPVHKFQIILASFTTPLKTNKCQFEFKFSLHKCHKEMPIWFDKFFSTSSPKTIQASISTPQTGDAHLNPDLFSPRLPLLQLHVSDRPIGNHFHAVLSACSAREVRAASYKLLER